MIMAPLLLALVMERPLMFFTDSPGLLPSSNITVPSQTLRITPAHYAELYGVASAIMERFWQGNGLGRDPYDDYIGPESLSFRDLPSRFLTLHDDHWGDLPLNYPTNRCIDTYRVIVFGDKSNMRPGHVPLHDLADGLFHVQYDCGSSLIADDNPPTFNWCENPFTAVGSNDWINVWKRFVNVSNDIPVAAWGQYELYDPDNWWYDDSSSPPGEMIDNFRCLALGKQQYDSDLPQSAELWDYVSDRRASESISNLMLRAISGCTPCSITNRTLRFDRNFLTALEAAASLEDTHYEVASGMEPWAPLNRYYHENNYSEGGSTVGGTMTISQGGDGLVATITDVPSVSGGAHYSISTNRLDEYNAIRYSASFSHSPNAEWQVGASRLIRLSGADLLEVASRLPESQWVDLNDSVSGTVVTWSAGAYGSISVDVAGSDTCAITASVDARRSATVTKSVLDDWFPYCGVPGDGNSLYWRNSRVSADVCYQQGMRWSTASNDVDRVDNTYVDLDPFHGADSYYRSQRLRQRLDQLGTVSLDYYTNRVRNAVLSLAGECLSKCNELVGCNIDDPSSMCAISSGDLSQARADMANAAGQPGAAGISLYRLKLIHHSNDSYISIQAPGSMHVTRLTPESSHIVGLVETNRSGYSPFSPSSEPQPARVDGAMCWVSRFRIKYYNLSHLRD